MDGGALNSGEMGPRGATWNTGLSPPGPSLSWLLSPPVLLAEW